MLRKIFGLEKKETAPSALAEFMHSSSRNKKKVFSIILKKANKDQMKILNR
jgi:hypothetical protein